ncbi:MAG: MFS transporter [Siculibacillus sp.]|nr:MFS transporter [Siculibacillus sp.]
MPPSASTAQTPASGREVLRYGDFRLYLGARFATGLAIQVHDVGVGWYVYEITRSAWALGLVGLAVFLPNLLFALVAGEVADRFDRRLVVTAAFATMAAAALGLLVTVIVGATTPAPVYALAALLGTARAFAMPASQALVPMLVPREFFPRAVAWVSSVWQISTIGGPALGGLLYAFGSTVVFASAFAAFAAGAIAVFTIRPRPGDGAIGRPSLERLLAGIAFIRAKPAILGAISLDLFAVLLGGATALLPIYARDILMTGPWGLGLLRSAPAIGAAAIGLWLARHPIERRAGHTMFAAVAGFGLATVGFGLSTSLWLSLVFLVVLGATDMVSVVIRQTLVQQETPDEMRGRVSAVNSVFIGASNELGQFESGALAAVIGPVGSVVVGGLGTLVVAGLWMRLFPDLAGRDRLIEDGKEHRP